MIIKMDKKLKSRVIYCLLTPVSCLLLMSCFGSKLASSERGEVTGTGGRSFTEPTPYGMTLIKRGHLKMGLETTDSLWGRKTPIRDISVDGFWMDETEVTNSKYRQFVYYVRDSRPCLVSFLAT